MLHDYPLLYVHVTCPYNELRRRHKERGDRGRGLNIDYSEQELVGDIDAVYDITVDTYNETKEECADKIIASLKWEEKSLAFKTLWSTKKNGNE